MVDIFKIGINKMFVKLVFVQLGIIVIIDEEIVVFNNDIYK